MREIKFRAWDVSEKRMLSHELFNTELSFAESAELDFWLNNDSYILMQYTGLKDKNKIESHDGDILAKKGHRNRIIVWEKDAWVCKYEDGSEGLYRLHTFIHNAVIIGNIHENPELISNKN